MSSFINKMANSVTNGASSIIGRTNATKLTNSINQSLFVKSKYRDFMKNGNTIQLLSKNSHCSLQIMRSTNNDGLIVIATGQIGGQYPNAHWVLEKLPNGNLRFRNGQNFLAFDNEIPCIMTQPPIQPKKTSEQIRARNEFRLHELLGSDENFALESVYYPGRYLSILPDGGVSVTKDRSLESAHFFVHVIHVFNEASNVAPVLSEPVPEAGTATATATPSTSNSASNVPPMAPSNQDTKEAEMARYLEEKNPATPEAVPTPPTYTNLFPTLPPS